MYSHSGQFLDYDTRAQPSGRYTLDGVRDWSESVTRRRPWSIAMSEKALGDYRDTLANKIRELVEQLAQRQSDAVDLSAWMSYFG